MSYWSTYYARDCLGLEQPGEEKRVNVKPIWKNCRNGKGYWKISLEKAESHYKRHQEEDVELKADYSREYWDGTDEQDMFWYFMFIAELAERRKGHSHTEKVGDRLRWSLMSQRDVFTSGGYPLRKRSVWEQMRIRRSIVIVNPGVFKYSFSIFLCQGVTILQPDQSQSTNEGIHTGKSVCFLVGGGIQGRLQQRCTTLRHQSQKARRNF